MPESEFRRWERYTAVRSLPSRRLEIQIAIVALTVARCMGGNTSLTINDFLISADSESKRDQTPKDQTTAASAFAGVARVRRLGQKKRKPRKAN